MSRRIIVISQAIAIDEQELEFHPIRASGPGGQHVNKVATAIQLRFSVSDSPSLPDPVKRRLVKIAGKRVNSQGVLVIEAKRFRSQDANRRDAVDRLSELLRKAAHRPRPRRATTPPKSSKEKRLRQKRSNAERKRSRQRPGADD